MSNERDTKYGIATLAERGEVSRRTVRYYVQRGLLPAPTGTGRGMHYTQQHLDRLIQIRTWQEAGISLGEIESRVRGSAPAIARSVPAGADANLWQRFAPHPGVELHINTQTRLDEAEIERILQGIRRLLGEK